MCENRNNNNKNDTKKRIVLLLRERLERNNEVFKVIGNATGKREFAIVFMFCSYRRIMMGIRCVQFGRV